MKPIEKTHRAPRLKIKALLEDVESLIRYRYSNADSEANERTVHGMMQEMKRTLSTMSKEEFETFSLNVQSAELRPDRLMMAWPHDEMEEYYLEHF